MKPHAWLLWLLFMVPAGCSPETNADAKSAPVVAVNASRPAPTNVTLSEAQLARIGVARVARPGAVPRTLRVAGSVELRPGGVAVLSAATDARVTRIEVEPGASVERGQILMRLDASAVATARADVARSEALRVRAEQLVEQERQLEAAHATSQRDSSLAKQELEVARAELAAARGNLRAWGASSGDGSGVVLRAPLAGVITHLAVAPAAVVTPGDVLVRVIDPTAVSVRALVPQSQAPDVALEAAGVQLSPDITCAAEILGHLQQVDPLLRAVPFRLRPEATCSDQLLEGARLEVVMPLRPRVGDERRLAVPESAVTSYSGRPVVFVRQSKYSFAAREVSEVETWGNLSYVVGDLPTAADVVVKGTLLLKGELMRAELE